MRKLFLFSFAALLALAAVGVAAEPETDAGKAVEKASQGAAAVDADPAQMKAWFHEAPSILPDAKIPLKGQPLWHTNGELSDAIIHEIFEEGQKNGFGGLLAFRRLPAASILDMGAAAKKRPI